MSDKRQETIADIITEMRGFKRYAASDSSDCRYVAYWLYQTFADRLEAAWKRDVERLNSVIQATVSHSDAEIDRLRREAKELRKQISNAAKLREAHTADPDWKEICARCRDGDIEPEHCEYYGEPNGCNSPIYGEHPTTENSSAVGNAAKLREALKEARVAIESAKKKMGVDNPVILEIIDEALAAPPRNCDVGTAKEQMARFKYYCQHIGRRCFEDEELRQKTCTVCLNEWAQMPYKEGGTK